MATEEFTDQATEKQQQIEYSIATREILSNNLANTRSAITEIRQNLETIEAGRRRAETKIQELKAELELERTQRHKAQEERADLAVKIDRLEVALKEANAEDEELIKTRERLVELSREKEELERTRTGGLQEQKALNGKLKLAVKSAEGFSHQVIQLETELAKARQVRAELESANASVEQLTTTNHQQSEELEAAKLAYDHLAEELKAQQETKGESQEQLTLELEQTKADFEDSEKKIVELQAQLEAVNQSREVANLDLMIAKKAIEELRASVEML